MILDNHIDRSERYYIKGDTHGEINDLIKLIKSTKNISIIHVGDLAHPSGGILPWSEMIHLNKILRINSSILYVIRGNHDNPCLFPEWDYRLELKNRKVVRSLHNIVFVRDYSTILFVNRSTKLLCVGGAISISREKCIEGLNWWKEEAFDFNPTKLKEVLKHSSIDGVVTHTAPSIVYPDLPNISKREVIDIIEERNNVTKMMKSVNVNNDIKNWYHGHFHTHNTSYKSGTTFHSISFDGTIIM